MFVANINCTIFCAVRRKYINVRNPHEGILHLFIAARFLLACVFRELASYDVLLLVSTSASLAYSDS